MGFSGNVGFSPFGGFGFMFTIIPIFVFIIFACVIVLIIIRSVQGVSRWQKNNESPILTVDATVITKRSDVHYHHNDMGTDHMNHFTSSTTYYYVTFEVASGDRLEFKISDTEYGLLAEHDTGRLTFQGTRYLGFERNINQSVI